MIEETSSMDQVVAPRRGLSRGVKLLLAGGVGLLVLVVLALPVLRRWDRAVDLDRLQLSTVERGELVRDVSAEGRVVAANHPKLFSPAQGIVHLSVKAGQAVKAGVVLATLESPELGSQLAQERAHLQSLESDRSRGELAARLENQAASDLVKLRRVRLEAARRDLVRSEKLRAEGLLNAVEYERARDAVRIAEVELEQAEEGGRLGREARTFEVEDRGRQVERQRLAVNELERRVAELTVRAPFDGLVASVDVQDRDAVAPNAPILTVVDLSRFEVEVGVPDAYAGEVTAGTPARITIDGKESEGELTSISPEVRSGQVQGIVAFRGATPAGLRQSQRAEVRLFLERRPGVLKIARGPFLEQNGGGRIYVLADGLATLRPIRVGVTSVGEVEIVEGLREGEQVIVSDTTTFNGANTVLVRR
jgi:HlyD family secretion protein